MRVPYKLYKKTVIFSTIIIIKKDEKYCDKIDDNNKIVINTNHMLIRTLKQTKIGSTFLVYNKSILHKNYYLKVLKEG